MKYTPEYIHITSSRYEDISNFRREEYNLYVSICRSGLREYYLSHMKGYSDTRKLSKSEIFKIAKKYKTLKEFRENEPKAIGRAKHLGIYKKCISHMKKNPPRRWDILALKKEAKKYKRMIDFINGSKSAYVTMMRLKLRDKVAKHLI